MEKYLKFKNIIENKKNILIVTHRNPDLDAFASSLAMHQILKNIDIDSKIYMVNDDLDIAIKKSLILIEEPQIFTTEYSGYDLCIVLDTNNKELVEDKLVLETDVVVLDHHIKNENSIDNISFEIIDTKCSSTSEMIVNLMKELNIILSKNYLTLLLAGIITDTNSYSVRATTNTFLASAFLLTNGADLVMTQELLKENRANYIKKQYFIRKSFLFNNKIMICALDENQYDNKFLSSISEELLLFEGVVASFTIGNLNNGKVGVSARSIGEMDVEKVMLNFNGGGHKTNAACQVDSTIDEVKRKLLEVLGG